MENTIYNSMISAVRLLEKQAVISNNLANISTTGFKEKFNFIIHNKNIKDKNPIYNSNIREYYNFSPGTLIYTQRNLDLFVKEDGWLSVKDSHGQEAYTKNGHLKVNSKGKLTIQGYEVIGNNCNIKIPKNSNIKILSDGTINKITKIKKNTIKNTIGALKLVRLSKKDLIQKENGLFYSNTNIQRNKNCNFMPHNKNVHVQSGFLEESNVNPTKNMIDMISNAREFEMHMKMISTCNQNSEYANQLLNIND